MNGFKYNPFDNSGSKELLFILWAANGWQISLCSDAVNSKRCLWVVNVYAFYGSHLCQRDQFLFAVLTLPTSSPWDPVASWTLFLALLLTTFKTLGSSCPLSASWFLHQQCWPGPEVPKIYVWPTKLLEWNSNMRLTICKDDGIIEWWGWKGL